MVVPTQCESKLGQPTIHREAPASLSSLKVGEAMASDIQHMLSMATSGDDSSSAKYLAGASTLLSLAYMTLNWCILSDSYSVLLINETLT